MSFNEHPQQILEKNQYRNGRNVENNIGEEIKENDFPILKKLISELASNLDKHSQYLKKEKDLIDEFLRENQKIFDNITLALKGYDIHKKIHKNFQISRELKKKNHAKSSQLLKIEKTVAELERRLLMANQTLNCIPQSNKKKQNHFESQDDEKHGLMEEEKQNLIADMDFEVYNFFF